MVIVQRAERCRRVKQDQTNVSGIETVSPEQEMLSFLEEMDLRWWGRGARDSEIQMGSPVYRNS